MLIDILFWLFILGSAIFVYIDATNNKIGLIPGRKAFFNISAGAWATCIIFLFIIALPGYLLTRKKRIELAKEFPVEVKGRGVKITILIIVWLFAFYMYGPFPHELLDGLIPS